jgi:hypothetical protein
MRNFRVSFALGFARFSTLTVIAIFAHVAPVHQVVSNSGTYRLSKIEHGAWGHYNPHRLRASTIRAKQHSAISSVDSAESVRKT